MSAPSGATRNGLLERGHAALVIVAGLPLMAYHGAKVASIATAPIAIAVPAATPATPPVLLDMATSFMPFGRVQQAAAEGTSIPAGVAVDAEGKATTDPSRATILLPLGGAKGSGLSLMFECLTGILAGTPIIAQRGRGYRAPRQNAMIAVFNIASFRPLNDYRKDIQELAGFVKGLPRREGFDELLLPGERGNREAELRRRTGFAVGFSLDRTEHYCPRAGRCAHSDIMKYEIPAHAPPIVYGDPSRKLSGIFRPVRARVRARHGVLLALGCLGGFRRKPSHGQSGLFISGQLSGRRRIGRFHEPRCGQHCAKRLEWP